MDRKTIAIAKKFAARIKKVYKPEKIILFGSRVRGDNFKTSDFDFIIVSKKFAGMPFIERLSKMYDYWDENVDLEAICYTPEEFKRKSKGHGIVKKAIREGVEL
jgi:predicted nucleotidyltransferase